MFVNFRETHVEVLCIMAREIDKKIKKTSKKDKSRNLDL